MQKYEVLEDMDAAFMETLKPAFEELAAGIDDVVLDMGRVTFLDSSGVGGIVFLFKRLRVRSLELKLSGVKGQPLRLLNQLQLGFLISKDDGKAAA